MTTVGDPRPGTTKFTLPEERLEHRLPDKKPLYTEAEARAEAERCLYCVDAPCIKNADQLSLAFHMLVGTG